MFHGSGYHAETSQVNIDSARILRRCSPRATVGGMFKSLIASLARGFGAVVLFLAYFHLVGWSV